MTRIHRRRLLQLSGAGAVAAATGGLAGILASGRAPAYGQAQTVHWVRWSDFVPASDVYLKGPFTEQCQKDLGIKLTVETINANDIQARVTSAIQSGTGPDIIYLLQQLAAALRRKRRRCQRRRRGDRQGAGRLLRHLQDRRRRWAASGSACRTASAAVSSPTANRGWPRPGSPDKFPEDLGRHTAPSARS